MANNSENNICTLSRIRIGILSALPAGALVGILESIVVVTGNTGLRDWWVFCYAAITYGLMALPVGIGLSVSGAILAAVIIFL